jgi:hypothetical protein
MDGNAVTFSPQKGGTQVKLQLFDRQFEQCAELCKLFPDYQFKFSAALSPNSGENWTIVNTFEVLPDFCSALRVD